MDARAERDITQGLAFALGHWLAYWNAENRDMSRLRDKLTQAKGVVKRVSDDIEAAADDLIAREKQLRDIKDGAFGQHLAVLNDAKAGLDELEDELRQFSNGGPPLDSSSTASDGQSPDRPTKPQS